jgi:hypothetical protein
MNIKHLTLGELQKLTPAIREKWHAENYAVFMALCMKERAKAGDSQAMTLVAVCVLIMQWLEGYLKDNHGAAASSDDYKPIVISFLGEVMTLSEILP